MGLNKCSGNMYPFCTNTINYRKGKCPGHDCIYCYMIGHPSWGVDAHLDEKELRTGLYRRDGGHRFIFVGSSNDHFAGTVPDEEIRIILERVREFPDNEYLFQSKNPARFFDCISSRDEGEFPPRVMLGTTVETNDLLAYSAVSRAPSPLARLEAIKELGPQGRGMSTLISIEPVIDFDLASFADLIIEAQPAMVSIGADSREDGLRREIPIEEPTRLKLLKFIEILEKQGLFVLQKDNLGRLLEVFEHSV